MNPESLQLLSEQEKSTFRSCTNVQQLPTKFLVPGFIWLKFYTRQAARQDSHLIFMPIPVPQGVTLLQSSSSTNQVPQKQLVILHII